MASLMYMGGTMVAESDRTPEPTVFSKYIRRLRIEAGLTQEEVAHRMRDYGHPMTQSEVGKWERAVLHDMPYQKMQRYAHVLGAPPMNLFIAAMGGSPDNADVRFPELEARKATPLLIHLAELEPLDVEVRFLVTMLGEFRKAQRRILAQYGDDAENLPATLDESEEPPDTQASHGQ